MHRFEPYILGMKTTKEIKADAINEVVSDTHRQLFETTNKGRRRMLLQRLQVLRAELAAL